MAVTYLDKYLWSQKDKAVSVHDIELYGVISIFLASKFVEIDPIDLSQIKHQICHYRFERYQFLLAESDIMRVLGLELDLPNTAEFMVLNLMMVKKLA